MMRRRSLAAMALSGLAAPGVLRAQEAGTFPDRPVRLVVPYPPGGVTDATARHLATEISKLWGQTLVVENRAAPAR
jgi:tripartite-type tricarboxylate transporter receptor subunit TctC